MKLIILAHTFATLFLVGLIWTIQYVHYPLFDKVGIDVYQPYQLEHQWRITVIVLPVMVVELATAAFLLWQRPDNVDTWVLWAGFILVGAIWLSTLLWQSPLHTILNGGFDADVHKALVNGNWFRTILWTLRGGLVMQMLTKLI